MTMDLIPNLRTYVWLGGSDSEVEGEWRWVSNGELFYDRNSQEGEVAGMYSAYYPTADTSQNVLLARKNDGLWNDVKTTSPWAVVCELCASGIEPVDHGCPVLFKRYERLSLKYDWGQACGMQSQGTSEPTSTPTSEPTSSPTSERTSEPTSSPTAEPSSCYQIRGATAYDTSCHVTGCDDAFFTLSSGTCCRKVGGTRDYNAQCQPATCDVLNSYMLSIPDINGSTACCVKADGVLTD